MSTITLNGPVVPADASNEVLRDALLHSPAERRVNAANYHVVEVGVRRGAYTDWVGAWNQSAQKVDAAAPTSILDAGRKWMRLKAGQAVVVKVTATGAPNSLRGACVTFGMALVGGSSGRTRSLVTNVVGLAQWDESVQLLDPPTIPGPVTRLPYITPSQITANTNDYAPPYFSTAAVMRLSSDASRNVTGIAGGTDGREVLLFNVGSFNIVLVNASGLSVAANQFSIGSNFTLASGGSCGIWYDAVTSTWRLL